MDSKSEKPLRLFVNPFAIWTDLALKAGEAMWASAHAAALRANASKVAVIPTADAPQRKENPPAAQPGPHAAKPVPQATRTSRSKAVRAKVHSKAKAKRRAKR